MNSEVEFSVNHGNLTGRQTAFITASLGGMSVADAAAKFGIDRSTYYKCVKNEALFVAELNQAIVERRQYVKAQVSAPGPGYQAMNVLEKTLTSGRPAAATSPDSALRD